MAYAIIDEPASEDAELLASGTPAEYQVTRYVQMTDDDAMDENPQVAAVKLGDSDEKESFVIMNTPSKRRRQSINALLCLRKAWKKSFLGAWNWTGCTRPLTNCLKNKDGGWCCTTSEILHTSRSEKWRDVRKEP